VVVEHVDMGRKRKHCFVVVEIHLLATLQMHMIVTWPHVEPEFAVFASVVASVVLLVFASVVWLVFASVVWPVFASVVSLVFASVVSLVAACVVVTASVALVVEQTSSALLLPLLLFPLLSWQQSVVAVRMLVVPSVAELVAVF